MYVCMDISMYIIYIYMDHIYVRFVYHYLRIETSPSLGLIMFVFYPWLSDALCLTRKHVIWCEEKNAQGRQPRRFQSKQLHICHSNSKLQLTKTTGMAVNLKSTPKNAED